MISTLSEKDKHATESQIRAAFDRYEIALMSNDIDTMMDLFWNSSETTRLTASGGAYGLDEIQAFRSNRSTDDITRKLTRIEITALTVDVGYANAEYKRVHSGRVGAQSHVWIRTSAGWKIASAHVSIE